MPYFSVVLEAAAFGAEIDWGTDVEMPNQKSSIFSKPQDFTMPDNFLDMLPIKTLLESIKLLRKKLGSDVVILGKVMGPWTLSYHLHGIEDFLVETITDPDLVREFLHKFKEISIKFAAAQFEAGADVVTIADHATADLVSPATYKEFLMPVHKEINEHFKDRTTILHCCGNTLDRIAMFREGGFPIFHFDSKNDIGKALIEAGDMQLAGCITNSEVLLNGTIDDVRAQTEEVVNSGVKFIAPECAIPLRVKNENLHEISKTVRA
jgi:[methyl-Co(III) methanol-specific corrinoid protein]:coenzyme M methyltransferase